MEKTTKYLVWYSIPYEGMGFNECQTLKEAKNMMLRGSDYCEYKFITPKPIKI